MSIKLFENRAILFKTETVYGTDPIPTAAANALLSFEGSVKIQGDKLDRKQDLPYFGADPFVIVGKKAMVEFTFDMLGSATVGDAAPCAPVLLACGHAETLTVTTSAAYNPISSAFGSATIYFYHAGLLFKITGARGTIAWSMSIKDWGKGKATFTGIVTAASISEAAAGSLTLTDFRTPPAVEMETLLVTIGGKTVNAQAFEFDQGGNVGIFEGSETREVAITDRVPTGTVTIFADAFSNFNPWALAEAYTDQAILVTVDGGASKTAALTIGQAQLQYADITNLDGAAGWSIPFSAKPSAGGDEYGWLFT